MNAQRINKGMTIQGTRRLKHQKSRFKIRIRSDPYNAEPMNRNFSEKIFEANLQFPIRKKTTSIFPKTMRKISNADQIERIGEDQKEKVH